MISSKEELMTMPLTILRNQQIQTQEEEKLVQEIVNMRAEETPIGNDIYRNDVISANIQTPEEEAKWQKIIDERVAKIKGQVSTPSVPQVNEVKETAFCNYCDSKGVRHKLNCTREK